MKIVKLALLALVGVLVTGAMPAQAQLFLAGSTYTVNPFTQAPGGFTDNLVKTDLINGFTVTGQFIVNITAGTSSGTLLSWEVQRALDPAFVPAQNMTNTSTLIGFIQSPAGNIAAAGSLSTDFTMTAGSLASQPFNYAGQGQTNFNLTTSTTFFYNPLIGGNFMRQTYFVDYQYNSPNPGTYTIDFPAASTVNAVPEPTALAAMGLGMIGLIARRRR